MNTKNFYMLLFVLIVFSTRSLAQGRIGDRFRNLGGSFQSGSGGTDSLQHRNQFDDSVTLVYRYLDSTRNYKLDSSIRDYAKWWYPVPATYIHLGNMGNAARSLLFTPEFASGFNTGFHAFDIYRYQVEKARFYNTTRPYSEITYQLGSRVEQVIELMHTQNVKPNWNVSFRYRLINSPGFYKSQKTNHNNYLLNSWYQSPNRRYNNYFAVVGNKMQSGENGGLADTAQRYIDDPIYKDRFNIPTKLGGDDQFSSNFFTTKINTGNKYNDITFLLRQQYDFGRKDSIVTDSTIIPLFFPRLRFEHEVRLDQLKYTYQDFVGDSVYYRTYYDTSLRRPKDTLVVRDSWTIIANDFSIYQYPDARNLQQFIKLGVLLQNIAGEFASGRKNFVNTAGHAEYRNRTRNDRWEIEANGKLYFTGLNRGDFEARISLQRNLGKKVGTLQLGFENTNRTPSFIFDPRTSFYFSKTPIDLKKENNTHLFASYFLPSFRMRLTGHYYLATNYTYFSDYYHPEQENTLFNLLQVALQKTIRIGKHWNWHTEIYLQQIIGTAPVNLPLIYTRNRFAYEGNLGFKNLDIAMGAELRYRSPYKADGYSPVLGQYYYQDSVTIRNPLPDVTAYLNFRIRSFKAFVRAENLNTARNRQGFGFTNNNFVAPGYALPGLQFRIGINWSFVN